MAADRAMVNISASVLPDELKTSVGGTTVVDLDEMSSQDNNKWIFSLTLIGTTSEDLIKSTADFLGGGTGEGQGAIANSVDEVVFFFVKHSGTSDGSTASTDLLVINTGDTAASGSAAGDVMLKPNECFFARMGDGTDVDMINAISRNSDNSSSGAGVIQAQVYALLDDGG